MRTGILPEAYLSMIGFWLAFLIPFAFVAVVKAKKIKLPPLVVYSVFGIVWFVATLILLPMEPRGRQMSWPTLVTIALASGLSGFLCLPIYDGLTRVWSKAETAVKEWTSLQADRQNKSRGSEDANQLQVKPTEVDRPSA